MDVKQFIDRALATAANLRSVTATELHCLTRNGVTIDYRGIRELIARNDRRRVVDEVIAALRASLDRVVRYESAGKGLPGIMIGHVQRYADALAAKLYLETQRNTLLAYFIPQHASRPTAKQLDSSETTHEQQEEAARKYLAELTEANSKRLAAHEAARALEDETTDDTEDTDDSSDQDPSSNISGIGRMQRRIPGMGPVYARKQKLF